MRKKILAVLLGFAGAFLILGFIEVFFEVNEKYLFLTKTLPQEPGHSEFDDSRSIAIATRLANSAPFQAKALLSEADGERLSRDDIEEVEMNEVVICCAIKGKFCKNCTAEHSARFTNAGRDIFRMMVKTDAQGRRVTPHAANPRYNILMFGDSFTVGEGVRDEESSPYQLALLRPEAQVYNLGLTGGAPSEMLYELTHPEAGRLADIAPLKTVILFTFIDDHMERVFCRSVCFDPRRDWMPQMPFYERVGNEVSFRGSFATGRRYTNLIYSLIARSAFLNYFNFAWPLRFTSQHFDFLADLLVASRDEAQKRYPLADFYLVLYPDSSPLYGESLAQACRRKGIKVLEYPWLDLNLATGNHMSIPGDGHPTPQAQLVFAHMLDEDLPKP